MASIKPLVAGTPEKECRAWRVRVSVGQRPNYRMVERVVRGPKSKAKAVAAQLEVDKKDGKISPDSAPLGKVLTEFLKVCKQRDRAPKTINDYDRMAKWLTAEAGTVELRNLTGSAIDDLIADVISTKGQSSADHYFRFLRAAMNYAVKRGYVSTPPTDRATAPWVPESEADAPNPEDVRRVLDVLEGKNADLATLVWVAAVTGTRRGGLCALTVGDIDFDHAELIHRHAASRVGGVTHIRPPKTKKTRRTAVDPVTLYFLDQQVRRARRRVELAEGEFGDHTYVWSDEADHSQPINPDRITGRWRRLCKAENLSSRFHDLRHYSATQMLDAGVSPVVAAAQLTHSSPAVTQARYAHVIPTRAHAAAEAVANTLKSQKSPAQLAETSQTGDQ